MHYSIKQYAWCCFIWLLQRQMTANCSWAHSLLNKSTTCIDFLYFEIRLMSYHLSLNPASWIGLQWVISCIVFISHNTWQYLFISEIKMIMNAKYWQASWQYHISLLICRHQRMLRRVSSCILNFATIYVNANMHFFVTKRWAPVRFVKVQAVFMNSLQAIQIQEIQIQAKT